MQFLLDLVSNFKQYSAQMLASHRIRAQTLLDLVVGELNFFSVMKTLFENDIRLKQQDTGDFNEAHLRFTDKGVYDVILTQAIEIISLLMQISPKETIKEFLNRLDLAEQLSIHAYAAPSEAVRQ